jgi:antitoxin component YwqK of YwqJK toxin-antitoxin module
MNYKTNFFLLIFIFIFCVKSFSQRKKLADLNLTNINRMDSNGLQGNRVKSLRKDSSRRGCIMPFKNNILDGYFECYYSNGQISECGYYKNGLPDGFQIAYWENGKKRGECNLKDGKLNGICITYDTLGKIESKRRYYMSKLDSSYVDNFVDSSYKTENELPRIIKEVKYDTIYSIFKTKRYSTYDLYSDGKIVKTETVQNGHLLQEVFYINEKEVKSILYNSKKPFQPISIATYDEKGKRIVTKLEKPK